jgi:hypothetical protein
MTLKDWKALDKYESLSGIPQTMVLHSGFTHIWDQKKGVSYSDGITIAFPLHGSGRRPPNLGVIQWFTELVITCDHYGLPSACLFSISIPGLGSTTSLPIFVS